MPPCHLNGWNLSLGKDQLRHEMGPLHLKKAIPNVSGVNYPGVLHVGSGSLQANPPHLLTSEVATYLPLRKSKKRVMKWTPSILGYLFYSDSLSPGLPPSMNARFGVFFFPSSSSSSLSLPPSSLLFPHLPILFPLFRRDAGPYTWWANILPLPTA